jgi:hypothetical protein
MDEIAVVIEGEGNPTDDGQRELEASRARIAQYEAQIAHAQDEIQRYRTIKDLEARELSVESASKATDAQFEQAFQSGDISAAKDAVRRQVDVAWDQKILENQRRNIAQASQPQSNSVDQYISSLPPPSRQWAQAHREWFSDPTKFEQIRRADAHAYAEGITRDTPEYFSHVERRIGLNKTSKSLPKYNPGDANTHVSNDGRTVLLTAGEKRAATDGTVVWNYGPNRGKPVGVAEFSRRKAQMVRQGLYSKLD